jgi:16S rRNA (cytosine967-C5)-methyltransferase
VSPARKTAFQILQLVARGAHSTDLLHSRTAPLDPRDAALATELVLGCLRRQAQLDWLVERYSGRDKFDLEVRIALRLGIYQLRHLSRVPPHAIVNESVHLVRWAQKASAAGLVNAVLRKVDRARQEWPSEAMAHCLPDWLWTKWVGDFGPARAASIADTCLIPPETYVRVPVSRSVDAERHSLEPTEVPGCYRLLGTDTAGFRIQDIGSQCIVPLLGLEPRMTFLDLCAAPGGKTAQALEAGVKAVAGDFYFSRIRALDGLACARVVLDAAKPLPFRARFERILLDAPCSGTGTLRRNPEIRWRVERNDLAVLSERQAAMLAHALPLLEPGGRLVYSTCSLEREENEDVVERVLPRLGTRYVVERILRRTPGEQPGDGFFAAVITSR